MKTRHIIFLTIIGMLLPTFFSISVSQGGTAATKFGDIAATLEEAAKARASGNEGLFEERMAQAQRAVEAEAGHALAKDPTSATTEDIVNALEIGELATRLGIEEKGSQIIEWARRAYDFRAEIAIAKNPCAATQDDILFALRTARYSALLGTEERFDRTMQWVHKAFTAIASDVTSMTNQRGFAELFQLAASFGFEDLKDRLMAQKAVSSTCALRWNVVIQTNYSCTQESGIKCSWDSTTTFPGFWLTGWRSPLGGLHAAGEMRTAQVGFRSYEVNDGSNWLSCGLTGTLRWNLMPVPPRKERKISPRLSLMLEHDRFQVSVECQRLGSSPLQGLESLAGPWEIPLDKVGEGKRFEVTIKHTDADGEATATFSFTPVK